MQSEQRKGDREGVTETGNQVSICIKESHLPLEVIGSIDRGPIYCNRVGKLVRLSSKHIKCIWL